MSMRDVRVAEPATQSPLMQRVAQNHEARTGHKAEIHVEQLGDSEYWNFECCKKESK